MNLKLKSIILSVFISGICFAQPNKGEFRKLFEQGNLMMLEQFYDTALSTFMQLHKMDSNNANVNYKVGYLYLQSTTQKIKSVKYLEKACTKLNPKYIEFESSEKGAPNIALYYLAIAFHLDYRFNDAISTFEKYKALVGKKNSDVIDDINHRIDWCKNGKTYVNAPVNYVITSMGDSINSPLPEYSPVISADEEYLFFTSRRKGTGGEDNKTLQGEYFEDIWVSRRVNGKWEGAKTIGSTINTFDHEATIGLSADGQQLFIYKDDNGDGNIYVSELNGDVWSVPEKMGVGEGEVTDINTTAWETHACVTADGNTLYFVSERKGGYGGRDIYMCRKLPNGKWGKAINMGAKINTPYDEEAPFIHPDGVTMFFSSKGHQSMGGFDIFFTSKNDTGWSSPENVGFPLNTTEDDVFYVTSTDGKRAYFSSTREGGQGEKDIYMVTVPAPPVEPVALMIWFVKMYDGSALPPGTAVRITNSETGEYKDYIPNKLTGKMITALPPGKQFKLEVEIDGNIAHTENFKSVFDDYYESQKESVYKTIYIGGPQGGTGSGDLIAISGTLVDKKSAPLKDVDVTLTDSKNDKNMSIKTDANGYFKFTNLPNDRNYIIDINEFDDVLKASTVANIQKMSGEEIQTVRVTNKPNIIKYLMSANNYTVILNIKKRGKDVVVNNPKTKIETICVEGTLKDKTTGAPITKDVTVKLTDNNGKITQTVTTKNGVFKFCGLPSDRSYLVQVSEYDDVLTKMLEINVTDETTGMPIQTLKVSDSGNKFKIVDIKQSITIKYLKQGNTTLPSGYNPSPNSFGDALYEFHFTYAKTTIDVEEEQFTKLIDAIIERYNSTGYVKVYVSSCASKVPVNAKVYANNGLLAKARAAETESKIIAALKKRGFDYKKVVFTSNYKVGGPEYQKDYLENRTEYEKWQYVRAWLIDKQ
jgi:tetratricopeptide (TPR) repeat protein